MANEQRSLGDIRAKIDEIDDRIAELLGERAACVLEVKSRKVRDKLDIYSPSREKEIISRVRQVAAGSAFPVRELERVFTTIVSASRSLIGELTVGFLGPELSQSNQAALKQFGESIRYLPVANTSDMLKKVEGEELQYGVLPLENQTNGLFAETALKIAESKTSIVAEVCLDANYGILSKDVRVNEVERIYGDLASFSACSEWLTVNLPSAERIVCESLPIAAKSVKQGSRCALLSPVSIASEVEMEVLVRGIENLRGQSSRYVVVGTSNALKTGKDKTALICIVEERAGALSEVLKSFSSRGVTLVKIESRPFREDSAAYMFYIEAAGHCEDEDICECLDELGSVCQSVSVLGSFPDANQK